MIITTNATTPITTQVTTTLTANSQIIESFAIDILNEMAYVLINFGATNPDGTVTAIRRDMWIINGAFYAQIINAAPTGTSIAQVGITALEGMVDTVLSTVGLMDTLKSSGELVVRTGISEQINIQMLANVN